MKKPWRYHGECCASGGPAAKTLGACGPSGFGLGTSLGTTFTMIPPRLFQIMSQDKWQSKPYGKLEVPGDDAGLLVVPGGVPGELQDLRGEVLHHGGHVHGSPGAHPLGVVAFPEEPVDPAHGELEAGPAGAGLGLALHLAALATSGHPLTVFMGSENLGC